MIKKVSLFTTKRDFFQFTLLVLTLFTLSLSLEFYNFKELTKFDSQLVDATVIKQYTKTKLTKKGKTKTYQVLKLKSDDGFTFYTIASKKLSDIKYRHIHIEAWAGKISFYEYMHGFFCFSKILQIYDDTSLKKRLNTFIDKQHQDKNISLVYQALFTAKPLPFELQTLFSNLGISHLIAISGFHLGILSALLYFLIKTPYKLLQNNYFPYRSYRVDSFIFISFVLLFYLLFLEMPPSLLRAYVMLLIAFLFYDRGLKIITMQTLFISVIVILAIIPRFIFSIGFWLSVSGVFYIFLFLIHFKEWSKLKQFLLLPIWVYLLMLPYSLVIFENFSLQHPLSILWSSLFTLFYPLSIALHIVNHGDLLDSTLQLLMHTTLDAKKIGVDYSLLIIEIILSLLSIQKRFFLYLLLLYSISIFIYTIYNVT